MTREKQPAEPTEFIARVYHCLLKLARTIADLAGCEEIQSVHLAEALQYRSQHGIVPAIL